MTDSNNRVLEIHQITFDPRDPHVLASKNPGSGTTTARIHRTTQCRPAELFEPPWPCCDADHMNPRSPSLTPTFGIAIGSSVLSLGAEAAEKNNLDAWAQATGLLRLRH